MQKRENAEQRVPSRTSSKNQNGCKQTKQKIVLKNVYLSVNQQERK